MPIWNGEDGLTNWKMSVVLWKLVRIRYTIHLICFMLILVIDFTFQPLLCEGPIDSWLPSLINSLKQTLADQLASVLNPAQLERNPTPHGEGIGEPPRTAGSMGRVEKSFTLDNCSEVILLATQIELSKKIDKSIKQVFNFFFTLCMSYKGFSHLKLGFMVRAPDLKNPGSP